MLLIKLVLRKKYAWLPLLIVLYFLTPSLLIAQTKKIPLKMHYCLQVVNTVIFLKKLATDAGWPCKKIKAFNWPCFYRRDNIDDQQ